MKKKILAAALAMTMMLGSSVGALASADPVESPDANGVYGQDVKAESTLKTPTINIEVPTTLAFTLNPYQMEVADASGGKLYDQVITAESKIVNNSNVGVSVNVMDLAAAKPEGVTSELTLLAAAPAAGVTTKSAFLYVELKNSADATYPAYKPTNKTQLAVPTTKTASKTDMLTLEAGDTTPTEANIRVAGNIVSNPSKAWTANDKINLTFKLTFTPQVNKPASN